jgi:5'-deoxynucleotidase YfbR-like HD superfamily hydrolase
MSKPTLSDIEHIVEDLILPFFEIERDMALPITKRRMENDAEHSWSVALIACSLAPLVDKKLDVGLVSQFAIVHDLVEVYAGDTSVWANDDLLVTKEERELKALELIKEKYKQFSWMADKIELYEQKDINEALYVCAVDKLVALMIRHLDKGRFYVDEKHITFEKFNKMLVKQREKAHLHPVIGEYYEELRVIFKDHPEYFFQGPES